MARRQDGTEVDRHFRQMLSGKRVTALAREAGFVQREGGKIRPFQLVWTLVLGFGHGRERSVSALRRCLMRAAGITLAPSSFYERFDESLVELMRRVVAHLLNATVAATTQLSGSFSGFSDIAIADASVLRLRELLEKHFPACRTNHTKAAAKLHVVMSVTGRNGHTIRVTGERRNDRHELRVGPWVRGRLLLFDLGYFGYRLFDRIRRNEGFFISRMKSNSNPLIVRAHRRWRGRAVRVLGKPLQEVLGKLTREVLDVDIEVQFQRRAYRGTASRPTTAFRFVAVRDDTTGAYHTYVTNVPPERLSAEEVARAYAARWEVELLFRAWKSEFRLDELPSRRKEVVEALVYASIATMLLTNRLLAYLRAKAGHDARRVTLRRVAAALRHFAGDLLIMVAGKGQHADATHVVRLLAEEAMDPHLNRRYLLERASASDPKVA